MSARSDFRDFLHDLALFLGLPALAIVGLVMAWRPWAAEPEDSVDPAPPATVGGHAVECHRSGGLPDPTVSWTPHLECQSPDLRVRALINAPQNTTLELVAIFERALSTYSTARAADTKGLDDSACGPVPAT